MRRPIDRAIVLFTARTIARSRQHRLYLAAYGGIGLAVAFAYARDLLYGPSDLYARRLGLQWNQPNVPLLIGVLVGFAICFPMNFAIVVWAPFGRAFPFWWMLDLWVGAILATLVAGWLYKDAPAA